MDTLKVFDFEREYITANDRIEMDNKWGLIGNEAILNIYLSRSQDIEHSYDKYPALKMRGLVLCP